MDGDGELYPYKPRGLSHLPEVLQEIEEFKVIFNVVSNEIELLNLSIEDMINQWFIDTATWGLELWERRFAITTDLEKSYEERREVVRAKRRGYGTVTKEKIKSVAQAFTDGRVKVFEESENYKFLIELINFKNKLNLKGLYNIIDEIKPAHLNFNAALTDEKDIVLKTKVENYEVNYNLCGTFNCGVEPHIVTEGVSYIENINLGTDNTTINQNYPISGEVDAGGAIL